MKGFDRVEGVAAALPSANIDTDVIMPKRYLKGIDRLGLGDGLFGDSRFTPDGQENPDFVLNRQPWRQPRFLVVGPNFGCGSSREHAVWGLRQFGVRGLIGSSFAGIFFDNCLNNGLLVITLEAERVGRLLELASDPDRCLLTIDLPGQTIATGDGAPASPFAIDQERKAALVRGLDRVGETLERRAEIRAFEADYYSSNPWLG